MSDDPVGLDASALLALLNDEPGADKVRAAIGKALMSSVNVAEVVSKLADYGMTDAGVEKVLGIGFEIVPFGPDEVAVMGEIRRATMKYGLSLGDRSCLATGLVRSVPVLTADNTWANAKIPGLEVVVLDERKASRGH